MGEDNAEEAVLLIHGFGANTNHWRYNQPIISELRTTYAIDLLGFGESEQPKARLKNEPHEEGSVNYTFDLWSKQIADFCKYVVGKPVVLVGNSIGGVVALRAAEILKEECKYVILINCAQRLMDDKLLTKQSAWMRWIRPILKKMVQQRWLSTALFRNAARKSVIRSILTKAYPSKENVNEELIDILHKPTKRKGAAEAFRGFINIFDDHLAPDLLSEFDKPVHLIWGELDTWEPIEEAKAWKKKYRCVESLVAIKDAGHCPHDEKPEEVNEALINIINHKW